MRALEIVTLIGLLILAGSLLARRLRLPAPLVLLTLGTAVGFVPVAVSTRLGPGVTV